VWGIGTLSVSNGGTGVTSVVANEVFASPNGSTGAPAFRALVSADIPRASTQSGVTAPTAPASTSAYTMQGLAGTITPIFSGNLLATISGTITSSVTTAGDGILYRIATGTGTAPTNGAATTGAVSGISQEFVIPATAALAADVQQPFSIQALVKGATLNTALWIDLQAKAVGAASDVGLANVTITAVEL